MRKATLLSLGFACTALAVATALPVRAQIVFDGNILHNNAPLDYTAGSVPDASTSCFNSAADLGDTIFSFNVSQQFDGGAADPLLGAPYNEAAPNWRPAAGSPALPASGRPVMRVPAGSCLQQVCYRGGVPPAPADDWTTGWTYYAHDGGLGRTDIDTTKTLVILTGVQPSYTMKDTANYLIQGKVEWPSGTTLSIDPGVVVLGDPSVLSYIVIQRGADINAIGTRQRPIIMTSGARWQDGLQSRGDWAGLVINGFAKANCAACTTGTSCFSEGDVTLPHCGNDDNDNSGTLRYVRVEYSGHTFTANSELNSFTMNSVGRGTTIDHCQAHLGRDDGFEWFGGTVACKYLVSTGMDDDNFDWQMGYRGCVQFAVSLNYSDTGDNGIEADNNEFNFTAIHRSNPTFSNVTCVGRGPNAGIGTGEGCQLRRGTAGTIINSIFIGFKTNGLKVDVADLATYQQACGTAPGVFNCPATITGVEPGARETAFGARVVPNPVVDSARLSFSLSSAGRTLVEVFDPSGRLVETVLDRTLAAGAHDLDWKLPAGRSAGTYFFRIRSGEMTETGRIVTMR